MVDVVQSSIDLSLGAVANFSSSDEYEYWEESAEEYANLPQTKSREAWCTPLDLQVQQKVTSRLASQTWASEMSLYDKISPKDSMESIKIPHTPVAIPTPKELKEVNWRKMDHLVENSK